MKNQKSDWQGKKTKARRKERKQPKKGGFEGKEISKQRDETLLRLS
jgi:hypothetical protein